MATTCVIGQERAGNRDGLTKGPSRGLKCECNSGILRGILVAVQERAEDKRLHARAERRKLKVKP